MARITLPVAQTQEQAAGSGQQEAAAKVPADQLDSLVAPIALYPDPMFAQVLAAFPYPLEIIQQWLEKNKTLKDKAKSRHSVGARCSPRSQFSSAHLEVFPCSWR